jgi:uncharacterized protein
MVRVILLLSLFFGQFSLYSQDVRDTVPEGFVQFFYSDGAVSSEGVMRNGRPDSYWRSYHQNGVLKSEGNRIDFELDGEWKFYNDSGVLQLLITYRDGKRNGLRKSWTPEGFTEEYFENDVKQGYMLQYDSGGILIRRTPFENGREHGLAFTYDRDSVVTEIMEYRRGVAVSREFVNRRDHEGRPHGLWKRFYPWGMIREEFTYRHGQLHGYYRKYDREGNLESIVKYIEGELITDSDEIWQLQIRRNYYPDMRVRTETTFREGVEHGIRREFNPDGSLKVAYIIDMGRILGYGLLDPFGKRQGLWKEFYPQGGIRSEGIYTDGIRTGEWVFYFANGMVEQRGTYDLRGREQGRWIWYYDNGNLRREEHYLNGVQHGGMVEYDEEGEIMAKGEFIEGEEDGEWFYQNEGYRQEGPFVEGVPDGEWIHYYPDGTPGFRGSFIDGLPDGKHVHFNYNGTVKTEGSYIMGTRHGVWRYHDEEGNLVIIIEFRNGIEVRFDHRLIRPEIKESDL